MSLLSPRVPESKEDLCEDISRENSFELTLLEPPLLPISLARQLRSAWQERRLKSPTGTDSPLPILDLKPWFLNLPEQIRNMLSAAKTGPLQLTTHPVAVPDLWQDFPQNPFSWANSVLVHLIAVTAILLPFALPTLLNPPPVPKKLFDLTHLELSLPPLHGRAEETTGGGGGGKSIPLPPSIGALPEFARVQFAPPSVEIPKIQPVLPMPATLIGPPELKLPTMKLDMAWGDPHGVPGPPSDGPGHGDGIGTGNGTGVGPGNGPGAGAGSRGGCCEGVFSVGSGVSEPVAIYSPTPAYSDEARKAKFQGTVILWIVVDAQGNVQNARLAKPLGMGLDEEAMKTVQTWRFKPALHNGTPVPVQVEVEVSFRLF